MLVGTNYDMVEKVDDGKSLAEQIQWCDKLYTFFQRSALAFVYEHVVVHRDNFLMFFSFMFEWQISYDTRRKHKTLGDGRISRIANRTNEMEWHQASIYTYTHISNIPYIRKDREMAHSLWCFGDGRFCDGRHIYRYATTKVPDHMKRLVKWNQKKKKVKKNVLRMSSCIESAPNQEVYSGIHFDWSKCATAWCTTAELKYYVLCKLRRFATFTRFRKLLCCCWWCFFLYLEIADLRAYFDSERRFFSATSSRSLCWVCSCMDCACMCDVDRPSKKKRLVGVFRFIRFL